MTAPARRWNFSLTQRLIFGMGGILVMLVAVTLLGQSLVNDQVTALKQSYQQSNERKETIDRLFQGMVDQETAVRGFILTRQDEFLEPFYPGRTSFLKAIEEMRGFSRALAQTDAAAATELSADIDGAQREAETWYALARLQIDRARNRDSPLPEIEGKRLFDRFRRSVQSLNQQDSELVQAMEVRLAERQTLVQSFSFGMLALTSLIGVLVVANLIRELRRPLGLLENTALALSQGNLDARVPDELVNKGNELAVFAGTFNQMADQLKVQTSALRERDILSSLREVDQVLVEELDFERLCNGLLERLSELTDSQLGALYLVEPQGLVLQTSLGLTSENRLELVQPGEGIVGLAASSRRAVILTDNQAEGFTLRTPVGQLQPRSLSAWPLVSNQKLVGVLFLGSVLPLRPQARYLLESLGNQLAVALLNSRVFREINEVRARLEATFEQMSDGVVISTPDARPLVVNLAGRRILGLEPEQDLASVDWVEQAQIYSAEGEPLALEDQPYQRAVRYNATVRSDLQLHIRGGRVVLVSVSASPIKDSEGEVAGVVAVFRDVTIERERERRLSEQAGELEALNQELTVTNEELEMQRSELEATNEELESQRAQIETQNQDLLEADRQKNNFLASMSHELRTPLNSILGFSQLLLRNKSLQGQEQILTQLERIYQNGKIQLRLVNDILDLAKIKAGKVELQYARVAIEPLIRETLASVESLATQKGLAVHVEIDPALEMVETDPYQFSTILSNLLSNAIKYTERGGVEILARSVSAQLFEVVVRDTGVGIALEEQSTVFDEFRRLEGAATRRAGGTGLGLTICKRLVSLLGGQIGLKSTPGQGSTFTVLLPSLVQQTTSVPPSTNLKVLVIEDDPQVQQLIATRLIDQPYQLMFAPDSIEGIQIARNEQPDVIVLDTILPRTDLWKVLFELRTDPATAIIPVILQSVQGERGLSIPLGLADFLNRPVGQESLLAVLRRRRIAPEGEAILIIDDNADGREYLAACLRDEGYAVELAASGLEALTYLEAHRPQLVILDLMMPHMDGFEVLRRLRLLPSGQNLPVLILSALDLSEEQRQTLLAQQTEQILKKGDQTIDELIVHLNATLGELRKHSDD